MGPFSFTISMNNTVISVSNSISIASFNVIRQCFLLPIPFHVQKWNFKLGLLFLFAHVLFVQHKISVETITHVTTVAVRAVLLSLLMDMI